MSHECPSCHDDCPEVYQCDDCGHMFCKWCGKVAFVRGGPIAAHGCPECESSLFGGGQTTVSRDDDSDDDSDEDSRASATSAPSKEDASSESYSASDYDSSSSGSYSGSESSSGDSPGGGAALIVVGVIVALALVALNARSPGPSPQPTYTPAPLPSLDVTPDEIAHPRVVQVDSTAPATDMAGPGAGSDPVAADQYRDPFAYCRAVRDMGGGEGGVADDKYLGTQPPPEVVAALERKWGGNMSTGATWRCMEGRVYACYLGASGRACRPAATSDDQWRAIREVCASNPNLEIVPNSANYSAANWRCVGGRPVVVESFPVDQRGYMFGNWVEVLPPPPLSPPIVETSQPQAPLPTPAEVETPTDAQTPPVVEPPAAVGPSPAPLQSSAPTNGNSSLTGAGDQAVGSAISRFNCVRSDKPSVTTSLVVDFTSSTVKSLNNFGGIGAGVSAQVTDATISWRNQVTKNYGGGGVLDFAGSIDRATRDFTFEGGGNTYIFKCR